MANDKGTDFDGATAPLGLDQTAGKGPWHVELASQQETRTAALKRGEQLTIGSGSGVDLRVVDRWVSARHVRLSATDVGLRVEDLGSTNGLYVGGALVREARLTAPYSSFAIGRTTVCVNPVAQEEPIEKVEPIEGMIGRSVAMSNLAAEIRRYARLSAPVLIQGESGTGKELVARALHQLSSRTGELVALNVGGLSQALADAELFGHRRGAFTGAHTSRTGAFELADRGTLFLDEIAELDLAVQVKLLRVLEDGCIRPLGAERERSVDARVVSASWKGLDQMLEGGSFRFDLFHRISRLTLQLPPLRKRRSDIVALSEHLLKRNESELGVKQLSAGAMARLSSYHWPGNVRELGSVLYRAASRCPEPVIELHHVEAALPKSVRRRIVLSPEEAHRLLRSYDGNVSAAARAAKVPRSTFRSWLARTAAETSAVESGTSTSSLEGTETLEAAS